MFGSKKIWWKIVWEENEKKKYKEQKLTIFLADKFPTSTPFKRKPSGRQGLILFC